MTNPLWDFAIRSLASMAGAFVLASSAAATDDDPLADRLHEKGLISAEERDSLREGQLDSSQPDTNPARADEQETDEEEEQDAPRPDISVGSKGLIIGSPDKRFRFAFGGRLQIDGGGFISDITRLGSGAELRRARIKSYGYVYTDWQYKIEVNFDTDLDVPVTDGWIRYDGFKPFAVTFGHQKVPFSQQSMTSSNWQVFQERALPDAFIDNQENGRRRLGAVLGGHGEHWNAQWGAFAEGLGTEGTKNEDFGTALRLVWAPVVQERKVLTFGGSVYYRMYNSASELEFSIPPESHIAGDKLVDTDVIAVVDDQVLFNFDASWVYGPFHAQAEYTGAQVNRRDAEGVYFSGYYAQAGWFITGESRNYEIKSGKYKRPKPTRDRFGAWELAMRWSSIDLQDKDILGGEERNLTAGLNWWVNPNVMFRFNYVYGMLRPNSGAAGLGGVDESIHAFSARAQIVF